MEESWSKLGGSWLDGVLVGVFSFINSHGRLSSNQGSRLVPKL